MLARPGATYFEREFVSIVFQDQCLENLGYATQVWAREYWNIGFKEA